MKIWMVWMMSERMCELKYTVDAGVVTTLCAMSACHVVCVAAFLEGTAGGCGRGLLVEW